MVEQETVADKVERTVLVEHTQVSLHLLGLTERTGQLAHQVCLFLTQRIRILWVNRRQISVQQRPAVHCPLSIFNFQFMQYRSVVHVPLRVTKDRLAF